MERTYCKFEELKETELVISGTFERHYYLRDIDGNPIATIALIRRLKENDIGVGLAFCADMDNFSREEGKKRAYGRAERALKRKKKSSSMQRIEVVAFLQDYYKVLSYNPSDPVELIFIKRAKSIYINPEEAEKCTFI